MHTPLTLSATAPVVRLDPAKPRPDRLPSIDLLRGVVMVLMALDHVRDFFSDRLYLDPVDLDTTTPGIFLTRWVTHFCAPTFIFLAGTAAFLSGTRGKSTPALSWFLFTRGLWLAFFEVTINRMMWMFNYDLLHHGAGVFWAIGWSMVVLAGLVYLPTPVVTLFGVAMIGLHNLLDGLTAEQIGVPGWLWVILHSPGDKPVMGDITFGTGYCLVPWVGVMAIGYGLGAVMRLDRAVRQRRLLQLGALVTFGFIILRGTNVYGDPNLWEERPSAVGTCLSFLNCTKYPPSLLFLLMTLGPALLALAFFDWRFDGSAGEQETTRGASRRQWVWPIVVFGRVPLFFYVLHIPLIHGGAVLLDYARFGWSPLAGHGPWDVRAESVPAGYGVSLPMVYLIWIAVVLILYLPCRWFAEVKRRRRDVWLSYL
jgi:uncharacterized membrane protein